MSEATPNPRAAQPHRRRTLTRPVGTRAVPHHRAALPRRNLAQLGLPARRSLFKFTFIFAFTIVPFSAALYVLFVSERLICDGDDFHSTTQVRSHKNLWRLWQRRQQQSGRQRWQRRFLLGVVAAAL